MSQNDPGNQGRSEEDADDVRLMGLVGRGDAQAFEQLIEKHQALVAGTVARMLGSSSDVEDIAQQVFIRVWKSAPRYVPRAKFTTWLLKITSKSPMSWIFRYQLLKACFFAPGQNSVPVSANILIYNRHCFSTALLVLKDSTSDWAYFAVMSQYMNASVASPEKCA